MNKLRNEDDYDDILKKMIVNQNKMTRAVMKMQILKIKM